MAMMLMINDNDDGNTDILNRDKGCDENVNANNDVGSDNVNLYNDDGGINDKKEMTMR